MIDPKSKCPCSSWKQYRKCYDQNIYDNVCIKFLEDNKHQRTKVIQEHIDTPSLEISQAVMILREKDRNNFLRSMMVLDCTLWETLSNLWAVFTWKEDDGTAKKCRNYYSLFCATASNSVYVENPYWQNIPTSKIYDLRSALTHFLWIWWNVSLWSHNLLDPIKLKWLAKEWIFLIDPSEFCLLLLMSGKLMIDAINNAWELWGIDYLQKLKRLYIKIHKDWAVMIEGMK